MSAMADKLLLQWEALERNINARGLPERLIMFAFAVFTLGFWGKHFLMEPLLVKQRALTTQAQNQQNTIIESQNQLQELAKQMQVDPDAAPRVRLAELKEKVFRNDRVLAVVKNAMVDPRQMITVLNDLARPSQGLRLMSIKSLPSVEFTSGNPTGTPGTPTPTPAPATENGIPVPSLETAKNLVNEALTPATPGAPAATKSSGGTIYRHGMEIMVSGNYLDLLGYIKALEQSSFRLLWGDLSIVVKEYPLATMTLNIYTLSTDRKWIGV